MIYHNATNYDNSVQEKELLVNFFHLPQTKSRISTNVPNSPTLSSSSSITRISFQFQQIAISRPKKQCKNVRRDHFLTIIHIDSSNSINSLLILAAEEATASPQEPLGLRLPPSTVSNLLFHRPLC